MVVTVDYSAKTATFVLDGNPPVTTAAGTNVVSGSCCIHAEGLGTAGTGVADTHVSYSGIVTGILPTETPQPPPGIAASVVREWTGSGSGESCLVDLRWALSLNDPERETGEFEYEIFTNGIGGTIDTISSLDADGVRYHQIGVGGNSDPGFVSFYVQATNTTTGESSTPSPSVSVDCGAVGSTDAAGRPIIGGTNIVADNADIGNGVAAFCSDLMGDSPASRFFCGLILVAGVFIAVAATLAAVSKMPMATVLGAGMSALAMMFFCILTELWNAAAGVVLIAMTAGVVAFFARKLWLPGRGEGS